MSEAPRAERVWDPFVRVFHWSLVTCVVLNQWVLEEGDPPHEWAGYTAAGLVGLRVLWGFIGPRHARFADFWPTPLRLREHLAALGRGEHPHTPGHNPLGALMMLALMGLVLLLGFTGWLQGTDRFWGNEAVQELHEGLAEALLWLAGLHAVSALIMGRLERTRLVKAMVTGVKERY
ncbi:MAG: cytochrome b/b6 domain-containing protein [Hydrogenophaga sp.]|uniref:cytochrome b/b6 domain-containing protein n=1 Tax=Hydrogenophaga sp. TaxID=1904254 RepID=UPI00257FEB91|nr:cytochrome b/b6 domain-containing protein [Hydrogenophaga sp.]MBL0944913.1 cytochrome b/b6 domain-containing protein [Hydrogenophaga sp.]